MYMGTHVLQWTSNEKGEQKGLQRLQNNLVSGVIHVCVCMCVCRNIVSVLIDCVCSVCECESIDRFWIKRFNEVKNGVTVQTIINWLPTAIS